MSNISNFVSSLTSRIHSTFTKLKSYKSILIEPKEIIIYLICLKNRNLIAFIGKISEYDYESYIYDYENNYSSRQKIELNLNTYDLRNYGIWSSFEFDNDDLIICYSAYIEARKKENNKYILIKKYYIMGEFLT